MTEETKTEYRIPPEKLIGKPVSTVKERFELLNYEYRIVNLNGLITADYNPQRYTLTVDHNADIVDAYMG